MEGADGNAAIRLGLAAGSLPALILLLIAGGRGAALLVAVVAISALVLSYLRLGVLISRASRDARAAARLRRERRGHVAVLLCAPLIVFASHPWGLDTIGVMVAVGLLCQAAFVQGAVTVVLVRGRRERLRLERREHRAEQRRVRGTKVHPYRSV